MTKMGFERAEVLVTVKTYPSPSSSYEETVCVAGVRIDRESPSWIRLYPIRFRGADAERTFKKYQRIAVDVKKHDKDPRVESHRPDQDSVQILGQIGTEKGRWTSRENLMGKLIGQRTTCELIADNKSVKMSEPSESLGLIKPNIQGVSVEPGTDWSSDQLEKIERASQDTLFGPGLAPLEPAPYIVKYNYRCQTLGCPGHNPKVLDWELGQAGRRWRREHGDKRAREMVRQKWEDEMCDQSRDTHFYIGNQARYRHSFSILGTWYPKQSPDTLF